MEPVTAAAAQSTDGTPAPTQQPKRPQLLRREAGLWRDQNSLIFAHKHPNDHIVAPVPPVEGTVDGDPSDGSVAVYNGGYMSVKDQLRVRIALKVIRKAHTGILTKKKNKRLRKIKGIMINNNEIDLNNDQFEELLRNDIIQVRPLDEIMKDAKTNFMLKRDRRNMDRESLKYGQPRPIYQELIAEIVEEHEKKEAARSRDHQSRLPSEISRLRDNSRSRLSSIQGLRPKSASGNTAVRQSRRAAGIVLSKEAESSSMLIPKSTTNDASYDGEAVMKPSDMLKQQSNSRAAEKLYKHLLFSEQQLDSMSPPKSPSNHQQQQQHHHQQQQNFSPRLALEVIPYDAAEEEGDGEGRDDYACDEAMDDIDMEPEVAVRLLLQQFGRDISRKPDSYDSTSSATDALPLFLQSSNNLSGRHRRRDPAMSSFSLRDTKILKARQARDEQDAARETRILEKIQIKESKSQSKQLSAELMNLKKTWLVAISLIVRTNCLLDMVAQHRERAQRKVELRQRQHAFKIIGKFFVLQKVRRIFRKMPGLRDRLDRIFRYLTFKMKFRAKIKASRLIATFLKDVTGISEHMRAIYCFRQRISRLQRWVRSWIECQRCRMRILWMCGEVVYKKNLKLARIKKRNDEKSAVKAMAKTEGFVSTVAGIDGLSKRLDKLLSSVESQAKIRQEDELLRLKTREERRQKMIEIEAAMKMSTIDTPPITDMPPTIQASNSTVRIKTDPTQRPKVAPIIAINMSLKMIRNTPVPWHKKIRNSAMHIKIYDFLRAILSDERKRHILKLHQMKNKQGGPDISLDLLKSFLKSSDNSSLAQISRLVVENAASYSDGNNFDEFHRSLNPTFLLLTQGGIDAIERLLRMHDYLKFSATV